MARSSTTSIGAASEPERSSSARSRASPAVRPVIWKCVPNTPRMVAIVDDLLVGGVAVTFLPLTSTGWRLFSM